MPDWLSRPTRPREHLDVGEGGVQRHRRVGVDHAEAVGPEDADAEPAGGGQHPGLFGLALGAGLGEAGRDDHDRGHPGPAALLDHRHHLGRRHAHHGEVDLVGDVEHRRIRPDAGHGCRLGVHGMDGAAERTAGRPGEQVAQDPVADAARRPAGADDRHRSGLEQPGDRLALGTCGPGRPWPAAASSLGSMSSVTSMTPSANSLDTSNPAWREHPDHAPVAGQDVGLEPADAHLTGEGGEVLEHQRGDAPAVVLVVGEEGDLGDGRDRGSGRSGPRR